MQSDPQTLDAVLTLQLAVAWAGEADTAPPRLPYWRTSLSDPFGGEDLLQRLAPRTWRWAVLRATRAAARRVDAQARARAGDPDRLCSLYHLGFAADEALDDRLTTLELAPAAPLDALPRLAALLSSPFTPDAFAAWAAPLAPSVSYTDAPTGRRLPGPPPDDLAAAATALTAALARPAIVWPFPHYLLGPR